ncbi:gastrula zinc finger protein XlCGF57.1-like [Conger conger]|uniref:gastrula zinc finger protein XlCGF57.1-like n=1 Tax=Conger conger TaxID=82655 RepID=UPI002A59A144|nr:gastrula zinc finger protein XlCGF57.1-like [Conger conger]
MSSFPSLQVQVASILEVLAKTAVVEITKLVDDGSAVWRLEMCRRQRENEALKTKLLLMEGELRAVRGYGVGTPGTSGAAAANGGEGPLCKEEELHMQPCPAGDPEKELQAELKQEPEEQPLTPALPLLESADWGMALQGVWSVANGLRVDQEQNGSSEHGDARLDDDFSPPHYTDSQRPRSEKDEGSASHLEQKQNGCPLEETSIGRPTDDISPFPLGSPGQCVGSAPCEAGSDTSAEAKSPCRTEGQEELICTCCGKTFPDALKLKTQEEQHSAGKRFSCSECGKGFTSSSILEKHEQVHSREKPFTCSVCGKSFSQSDVLQVHESTHTGQKQCASVECGKHFKRKTLFKAHQCVHTKEKPFTCEQCGKGFSQKYHLKTHQRVHTGERPHCCNECGKSFTTLGSLKHHQSVHTKEKPFACEQCGKCFSLKGHLKTHQVIHTGEKCFSCTVCNKSFAYLSVLKQHQRVHTGEKPHCCNECGKSFTTLGSLKDHQSVHTKEKPFACEQCGKCFSLKGHLKTHQVTHTGEKCFSCTVCNKSFAYLHVLKQHQRIHTGEKPYCCNECGKSFAQLRSLKSHQKVHSGGNTVQLHTVQQEFLPESHSSETHTFSGLQTNCIPTSRGDK